MAAGDPAQAARDRMVDEQLIPRGITDKAVLAAMRTVPRHQFVPPEMAPCAYSDRPLPIGFDQTISQPSIVARMTELAAVRKGQRVLEIGTGSGYQAAVLAALGAEVYTIEIVEQLGKRAATDLARLGYGSGQDAHRRRLPGLARGGAVRRDHRDRGPRAGPRAAQAAAQAGRAAGHPGRRRESGADAAHAHRRQASSSARSCP